MGGKPITDEQHAQVVKLYESGMSRLEVGLATHLSHVSVRHILAEAGYPPKEHREPVHMTDEMKQEIVRLRNLGLSAGKIAEATGINKRTVLNVYKEEVENLRSFTTSEISAPAFIKAWQESTSSTEVAEKLGITVAYAIQRAWAYRQKGVPLKRYFSRRSGEAWDELKEFAELFLDDDEADALKDDHET